MLNSVDLYTLTPLLKVVFWIELVVYFGIGIYEIVDDFFIKPAAWVWVNGKINGYISLRDKVGHKMHAALCFLLGFIALNGILQGAATRLELELCFLSLALLMMSIWMTLLPGKLGLFVVTATKPEFWLQIIMLIFFSRLIRSEVIYLCVALNLWGILVYFFQTRKKTFQPFTYEAVRSDMLEAGFDKQKIKLFDKIGGHTEK